MDDNILDFSAEKGKREAPDAEFRKTDDFGRPMFSYLLGYEFDGGHWSTTIWAYSAEDAAKRVAAMRETLTCDGQIFTMIEM